jgi:hypothetical protein
VGSSYRKRLAAQAKISPAEMLVNELFIGDHGRINSTCATINRHRTGGFQQHLCYMTFTEQCSYKYLLNSASIGYANKFKYLLLCGSVVLYVCIRMPGGESVWIEPNDRYHVTPAREFENAIVALFGPESYQVKVDNSLPERAQRRWEKRGNGGGGGGGGDE